MSLRHLPQRALVGLVRAYRLLFSPWLGSQCRFEPTCSAYALGALQAHGAAAGSYFAARRVLRCHPWCVGGHDPVPAELPPRLFSWRRPGETPPLPPSSSSKTAP